MVVVPYETRIRACTRLFCSCKLKTNPRSHVLWYVPSVSAVLRCCYTKKVNHTLGAFKQAPVENDAIADITPLLDAARRLWATAISSRLVTAATNREMISFSGVYFFLSDFEDRCTLSLDSFVDSIVGGAVLALRRIPRDLSCRRFRRLSSATASSDFCARERQGRGY